MTALEKLAEERDEQKNARIDRILAAAFTLFSSAGIEPVAMTDIAKKAEIGVASLYRYFSTKDEIAIRTAIWAWEKQISEIYPFIENDEYKNGNGLSRLSIIFGLFKKLYKIKQGTIDDIPNKNDLKIYRKFKLIKSESIDDERKDDLEYILKSESFEEAENNVSKIFRKKKENKFY